MNAGILKCIDPPPHQDKLCYILCNIWSASIFKIWIGCLVQTFIVGYLRPPIFCFRKRGYVGKLFIFLLLLIFQNCPP